MWLKAGHHTKVVMGSNAWAVFINSIVCSFAGMKGLTTQYNIATMVNHPLFVGSYARIVVPLLAKVHKDQWKEDYMLPTVAEYLLFHKALLLKHNIWSVSAERLIAKAAL